MASDEEWEAFTETLSDSVKKAQRTDDLHQSLATNFQQAVQITARRGALKSQMVLLLVTGLGLVWASFSNQIEWKMQSGLLAAFALAIVVYRAGSYFELHRVLGILDAQYNDIRADIDRVYED